MAVVSFFIKLLLVSSDSSSDLPLRKDWRGCIICKEMSAVLFFSIFSRIAGAILDLSESSRSWDCTYQNNIRISSLISE